MFEIFSESGKGLSRYETDINYDVTFDLPYDLDIGMW